MNPQKCPLQNVWENLLHVHGLAHFDGPKIP